jgi:D-alanyl-D-alanine carboxypeptidase
MEVQENVQPIVSVQIDDQPKENVAPIEEDFIKEPVKPVAPVIVGDPRVKAEAYIVADVETGKVYASRNMDKAYPVASMSKLVTALVALDTISSTTLITISEPDTRVASDTSMLRAGESYTLDELLKPLLLSSSNVASMAIASTTGDRTAFMEHMSAISWEVGMPKTFFADPSGLSAENVASARDIYALARYLYEYRPEILSLTTTPRYDIATTTLHDAHIASSTHPFVYDSRFVGGKTGRTPQAGETMLTLLKIDGHVIAFVILKSKYGYRALDTKYLVENYLNGVTN